ncbi:MAG: SWIM zinc finger family protein [Bacteroidales bacterium]|jgi:hypothetical protein|nr:SWIM zinc finger family protein [Bacteroidales bacterium]
MTDIFDIQQTAENRWQAKYHGNYGTYTIKMTLDEKLKPADFSCSCPSDYYPCKHIAYVQEAIKERLKKNEKLPKTETPTINEVLNNVSLDELRVFVVKKAKYNEDLTNAIMLEFAGKLNTENKNIYIQILRKALNNTSFNMEDYYEYEESFDLEILDEWYKKAKDFINRKNYNEAVLICKACIEEYATWVQQQEDDVFDYLNPEYENEFFDLLQKIADTGKMDAKALYDYCKTEMTDKKYKIRGFFDEFNNLLAHLAPQVNPDEFIDSQRLLLKQVTDKTSHETEKILQRMIDFYNNNKQSDKAVELIESNVQIELFCKKTIEKRIAEKKYTEAKKLISDYLLKRNPNYLRDWNEYLLTIAQKEKDTPTIRKIALGFINQRFDEKKYRIYKSTFTSEEWAVKLEALLKLYEEQNKRWNSFDSNIADLLLAENATERLLNYVEKHPSPEIIEKYHKAFANEYPQKTLTLFREAVNKFAENNLGRDKYEYIKRLLEQMKKIQNGEKAVSEMIATYKIIYKHRRAMMEILRK